MMEGEEGIAGVVARANETATPPPPSSTTTTEKTTETETATAREEGTIMTTEGTASQSLIEDGQGDEEDDDQLAFIDDDDDDDDDGNAEGPADTSSHDPTADEGDDAMDDDDVDDGDGGDADSVDMEDDDDDDEAGDPTAVAAAARKESEPKEVLPGLFPSPFPTRPPVIRFAFTGDNVELEPLPAKLKEGLKWKMQATTPNLVKKMVRQVGFTVTTKNGWIGTWGKHMKATSFRNLRPDQKINHYPGSFNLGRKDRMWKNIARMQAKFSRRAFSFVPDTYCLPGDMHLLKRVWNEDAHPKWILKPNASARGIGIRVIHQWSQVPKRKSCIVQRYLAKPFLVNETKFDLRIYVYVSSLDPLRVYICKEGLARFATQKYSNKKSKLKNRFMHLTNYSVNKKSSSFVQNEDASVCQGHKWGLRALFRKLKADGVDTDKVWNNICDVVIKTLLSVEAILNSGVKWNCKQKSICHELFGFDVMLESNLKAFLIEVNISPSLASSSPLDRQIKGSLLRDIFNTAGFMPPACRTGSLQHKKLHIASDKGSKAFTSHLTPGEKLKHAYFVQNYEELRLNNKLHTILDDLTDDDICTLMETEEENARRGDLVRLAPSPTFNDYFPYFEAPRYYNILCSEWEKRYKNCPEKGIDFLHQVSIEAIQRSKEKTPRPFRPLQQHSSATHNLQFLSETQFYRAPQKPKTRTVLPSLQSTQKLLPSSRTPSGLSPLMDIASRTSPVPFEPTTNSLSSTTATTPPRTSISSGGDNEGEDEVASPVEVADVNEPLSFSISADISVSRFRDEGKGTDRVEAESKAEENKAQQQKSSADGDSPLKGNALLSAVIRDSRIRRPSGNHGHVRGPVQFSGSPRTSRPGSRSASRPPSSLSVSSTPTTIPATSSASLLLLSSSRSSGSLDRALNGSLSLRSDDDGGTTSANITTLVDAGNAVHVGSKPSRRRSSERAEERLRRSQGLLLLERTKKLQQGAKAHHSNSADSQASQEGACVDEDDDYEDVGPVDEVEANAAMNAGSRLRHGKGSAFQSLQVSTEHSADPTSPHDAKMQAEAARKAHPTALRDIHALSPTPTPIPTIDQSRMKMPDLSRQSSQTRMLPIDSHGNDLSLSPTSVERPREGSAHIASDGRLYSSASLRRASSANATAFAVTTGPPPQLSPSSPPTSSLSSLLAGRASKMTLGTGTLQSELPRGNAPLDLHASSRATSTSTNFTPHPPSQPSRGSSGRSIRSVSSARRRSESTGRDPPSPRYEGPLPQYQSQQHHHHLSRRTLSQKHRHPHHYHSSSRSSSATMGSAVSARNTTAGLGHGASSLSQLQDGGDGRRRSRSARSVASATDTHHFQLQKHPPSSVASLPASMLSSSAQDHGLFRSSRSHNAPFHRTTSLGSSHQQWRGSSSAKGSSSARAKRDSSARARNRNPLYKMQGEKNGGLRQSSRTAASERNGGLAIMGFSANTATQPSLSTAATHPRSPTQAHLLTKAEMMERLAKFNI